MPWVRGQSGNPAGYKRGRPHRNTTLIRKLVNDSTIEIVKAVIEAAKLGDGEARALFFRFLMPRHRFVSAPVDMPVAQSAGEAQGQIAMLTAMAARGDLDLDALHTLSRSLTMAIDTRLSEIEDIIGERERERDVA